MHTALQIQEILRNIFGHCGPAATCDLRALAGTCRAFKELALDVLWDTLFDPSPIARCLPEASHFRQMSTLGTKCSFSRPLEPSEWNILRSYTRRIRTMLDHTRTLDWESVKIFLNPSATEPLFPNLRYLYCGSAAESKELLYMPFPSLDGLSVSFSHKENRNVLQRAFESFSQFSPNIRKLSLNVQWRDTKFSDYFSDCIGRWRNLQAVDCGSIALNADALAYLSRMPALARLNFVLTAALPDRITSSDAPLVFPSLQELILRSECLELISQFLSHIRLPATTDFIAFVDKCPSKLDVSSFWTSLQSSCMSAIIQRLHLEQSFPVETDYEAVERRPVLCLEDLQPCAVLNSLRRVTFDVEWDVNLTSSSLLTLTSAWSHLEDLSINADWGWNSQGGITPDGVLRLLQTFPSLKYIALAMDTRGYTEIRRSPEDLRLTLPPRLFINVVDSFVGPESVSAIATFPVTFLIRSDFSFTAWNGWVMEDTAGCGSHWDEAYRRAKTALRHSRLFMSCLLGSADTEPIGKE